MVLRQPLNSIHVDEDFRENRWQEKHMTFNLAGEHKIFHKTICMCVYEMSVFVYTQAIYGAVFYRF